MKRSSPNVRRLPPGLAVPMLLAVATPAAAQVRLDRADPTISEQALPTPKPASEPTGTPSAPTPIVPTGTVVAPPRTAAAIMVDGNAGVPTAAFAGAVAPFIGRVLDAGELGKLAGAVADTARARGFPFATAAILPQPMTDGILHVTLDEGRIDAVRVIGAINPIADRILTSALVTRKPLRRGDLERALLLVGDLPGVTVKSSRYVRQDGFGILLVTIAADKASAYLQVDNRGNKEVGPIRSTLIANVRDVVQAGDELGIIAAATPIQPTEFAFLRGRYTAPVDSHGSTLAVSASYGRARPGASLKPLEVIGNSVDVAVGYARPLVRRRADSLWAGVELRALKSDQTLLGAQLRDDRLTTATATLNGASTVASGAFRGEITVTAGLPAPGVTHQGDVFASRPDGDARFVTLGYSFDWTAKVTHGLGVVLASAGQVATRPLLATTEIGAGGPAFGRGYDYAERTGDEGVLGSAELRADAGRVLPGVIDRLQFYGFLDGGYVDNLRGGFGGGSLLSTGTGARLGHGLLDGMIEVAFPLNADRFDTGDRQPRFSFRLSRGF